jgi:anti-sigma regulatory factor (Ser/Thr protein kinase)
MERSGEPGTAEAMTDADGVDIDVVQSSDTMMSDGRGVDAVGLNLPPQSRYIRIARLVGAGLANELGFGVDRLDDVRLAIGEACTRAVAVHRRHGLHALIAVAMSDGGRFTVRVVDRGPSESATQEPGETTGAIMAQVAAETGRAGLDEDMLTFGVGLALLTGLVSDLEVAATKDGSGTEVKMSWPVHRR